VEDVEFWLLFTRLELPPQRQVTAIKHFGSPRPLFEASREEILAVFGLNERVYQKIERVERTTDLADEVRRLEQCGAQLVTWDDERYPPRLREISCPPPVLYVLGDVQCLSRSAVAMVGTRRPSTYGLRLAREMARELAARGMVIVSGLAVGIDAAAHEGALDAGGKTVAVLGCGIDVVYPAANRKLRERIKENGALVTEFSLGARPQRWMFPQRNRVISGLALGTIVVEAPERSGALITAHHALEQGREVMAVPGDVQRGRSRGCHNLIRDGAHLVECADDVLDVLGLPRRARPAAPAIKPGELSPAESAVYNALGPELMHVDDIAARAGLDVPQASATLMLLEMKGLAQRFPGSRYCRAQPGC